MMHCKYSIYDYWKNKAFKQENLWAGLFENKPIQRESILINPIILRAEDKYYENGWAAFPNIYAVIGFLQYIYLPTAFSSILLEDYTEGYYMSEDLGWDLEALKSENPYKKKQINKMIQFYEELIKQWHTEEQTCIQNIRNWANRLNEGFMEEEYTIISFHLFTSPQETIQYIIRSYELDLNIKDLERDLGFTKEQLIELSGDAIYDNEFMKWKFMKILDGRLTMMI